MGFHVSLGECTWTPKVGKIIAFMAIIRGLGLLFYILLRFRYWFLVGKKGKYCMSYGLKLGCGGPIGDYIGGGKRGPI